MASMGTTPASSHPCGPQARVLHDLTKGTVALEKGKHRVVIVTRKAKGKAVHSRAREIMDRDRVRGMAVANTRRRRARSTVSHAPAERLPNTDRRRRT